jgi:hypothetical protein
VAGQLIGIRVGRHRDLQGRERGPSIRRLLIGVLAIIPVAALFDAFGQAAAVRTANGPGASLTVDAPDRVRGGLIFTSRFTVHATSPVDDMRLLLGAGWFQGTTFNGIAPQADGESSHDGWTEFDFGKLETGQSFTVWMSWQVNPTNVGRHAADVALLDGGRRLTLVHRTVTVAP